MLQCPHCNKALYLPGENILVEACECGTIVTISPDTKQAVAATGPIRELVPEGYHYLKPGTTGSWKRKKFALSGRLLAESAHGAFSYWTAVFENGDTTILSEGYGHYSMLRKLETEDYPGWIQVNRSDAGATIYLNGNRPYRLVRKSVYDQLSVEGAICMPEPQLPFHTAELFSEEDGYLEIIYYKDNLSALFELEFLEPDGFKFEHTATTPFEVSFPCIQCHTTLTSITVPYTRNIVCSSCRAQYTYNYFEQRFEALKEDRFKDNHSLPYLLPGMTGSLNKIPFTVAGCCIKEETSGDYPSWTEYTLFNPVEGFSYLSEYKGHWVYVKEWPRPPLITEKGKDYIVENDNHFDLYNAYRYRVTAAWGAHIYNLHHTRQTYVREFVYPPQTLIEETSGWEECWFYGEHINPAEVKKAFRMTTPPPARYGTGSVQPLMIVDLAGVIKMGVAAIVLLLVLHMVSAMSKQSKSILFTTFNFEDSVKQTYTSNKFHLNKHLSNIELKLRAPDLSDSWVEVSGTLVNTDKGLSFHFSRTLSFYSGIEEGERWSEGSTEGSELLTDIPEGNYYIEFEGVSDSKRPMNEVSIQTLYDVPVHRNLNAVILIVCITGVVHVLISNYNKNKRWNA
ncbi:MAG: DUF4178 domain-containing protein [Niabella sp.]|nr:DUF4178 domain-containing protein [Niabella sp.]